MYDPFNGGIIMHNEDKCRGLIQHTEEDKNIYVNEPIEDKTLMNPIDYAYSRHPLYPNQINNIYVLMKEYADYCKQEDGFVEVLNYAVTDREVSNVLSPLEIAIKYVHGKNDALTNSQEIIDMHNDIENLLNHRLSIPITDTNGNIIKVKNGNEKPKPSFEFTRKAVKYDQGIAVDTDGLSLSNDDLPTKAYTLEEGCLYNIKIYKIKDIN